MTDRSLASPLKITSTNDTPQADYTPSPLPRPHEADHLATMRTLMSDDDYRRVLRFIRQFYGQYKYAPLVREIAEGCHFSRTKTDFILYVMLSYGKVHYVPYIPRSVVIHEQVNFP